MIKRRSIYDTKTIRDQRLVKAKTPPKVTNPYDLSQVGARRRWSQIHG
jgi:hypothetical protein